MKLLLCRNERITFQFATLDQDADLTGRFHFSLADRLNDSIVLEFGKEFSRSHMSPAGARAAPTKTAPATAESAEPTTAPPVAG
jgi:hypothetical protein